ncbi:NAD dependent epimerase/dehydratase family protein [Thelonectria olida]|uniref:NAD dependent epimerase/dehydratase family protein n=1 Tax=Thelonectria olida TaxID=1576542 RepID=A0A9P9AZU4_9HYPO|nr:NAD dependent epimerase/dehydratase family protein [Thelonectria olida]
MASSSPQILLTGATGYIGGTVLTHLINSSSPAIKNATITFHQVVYEGLDDLEATASTAAQLDLVINATLGYHLASAQALLRGLARRKKATGRDVWMIHTSGVSNLGDQPISGAFSETRECDDAKDDIYAYEQHREALPPYPQRSTELGVTNAGLEWGVTTLVIMSPTIYGVRSGLFNTASIQIPTYIRSALNHGCATVVGEGKGVWDRVHVQDLADLYEIVAARILERGGEGVPTGKRGIIFSGNGRHSWADIAQSVAGLQSNQVDSINLAQAVKIIASYLDRVDESMVEVGLSSNSRTVSSVARTLGRKPTRGEKAWNRGFHDDLKAVLKKQ